MAVAALNAHDGHLLAWKTPTLHGDPRPYMTVLAASGARLYLGGTFAGSVAAVRSRDAALVHFVPKVDSWGITSIVVSGRSVFVGGTFGGGAFDATTSKPLRWSKEVAGAKSLAVAGSTLFLDGDLRSSIGAHNLRALDIASGRRLSWAPNLARYVSVGSLAVSGGKVFVGGSFCSTIG